MLEIIVKSGYYSSGGYENTLRSTGIRAELDPAKYIFQPRKDENTYGYSNS
jgi:hypothetical protein